MPARRAGRAHACSRDLATVLQEKPLLSNRLRIRSEAVSALGGIVEWYDYLLFAFMTPVFSRVFFPESHKTVGIIAGFGVFAAGYVIRPLGALYWGNVGDRKGRKKTLVLSTAAMVPPMVGMAVLPGFETLGLTSAVILVLLRFMQGFAVGGETAGVIVVLMESAKNHERGRVEAYSQMVIGAGILLASLLAALVTATLSQEELDAWGWRLLYGVGAVAAVAIAWLLNRYVVEPEDFKRIMTKHRTQKTPVRATIRQYPFRILKGIVLAGFAGVSFYIVLAYFTIYMESVLHVNHVTAILVTSFSLALWSFTAPIFGGWSDRWGRRRVAFFSTGLLALLTVPCFLLAGTLAVVALLAAQGLMTLAQASYNTINAVQLGEMFPVSARYTGVSITYNFGQSIVGGTAPFVGSLLAHSLGLQLAPAYYLVLWCVIGFLVTLTVPETAGRSIADLDRTGAG